MHTKWYMCFAVMLQGALPIVILSKEAPSGMSVILIEIDSPFCPPTLGSKFKMRGVVDSAKSKLQFLLWQEAGIPFTITST